MQRKRYPSDLTDAQWTLLEPWIPPPRAGGRPRKTNMREVVNAIFDRTREGCTWRALPHDFPPWKTVYNYFEDWQRDGTWDQFLTALRMRVRRAAGRDPDPRVACLDSPSAKTAGGGEEVGTAGGKKVRGRKRPIVGDTLGLLLAVVVTAANVDDARGAELLFAQRPGKDFPRLEVVQADNK
jgi:putative transposase